MNNMRNYVELFFEELEVYEDIQNGHNYKSFLRQAIYEFLDRETKETAFAVYQAFFDSYRIKLEGAKNPFLDLLDILKSYEENAATLIDKQRDHYIHSVNVFILGLCFYTKNANFQNLFNEKTLNKDQYLYAYSTKHEEFLFRWGIASLFHDVGYPIEIIGKQIIKFIQFASEVDGEDQVKPKLEFENFEALNTISEVIPKSEFIKSYYEKYDSCVYIDLLKPTDLLAHKLHIDLGIDLQDIKTSLNKFVDVMAKNGFIDHGFYSAIIVLKWYGFLIQSSHYHPENFYYPLLDSASAILLHNYYRNAIMKPPFNKGMLSPSQHPIAFLLILCDELQEWNRQAYGIQDKLRTQASDVNLWLTDNDFEIIYLTSKGSLPDSFSTEKQALLNAVLDINAIFSDGFTVSTEAVDQLVPLALPLKKTDKIVPRPLLDNLEKLAIAIHKLYNQQKLEQNPHKPLEWPNFSDLPDSLKYSNLRQARSIMDKIQLMGWEILPGDARGKKIETIDKNIIETLAEYEHESWVDERASTGWVYGPKKDVAKKISPYLIPYSELTEEIKELDRDTIRNIPDLLEMIGMAIFEMES